MSAVVVAGSGAAAVEQNLAGDQPSQAAAPALVQPLSEPVPVPVAPPVPVENSQPTNAAAPSDQTAPTTAPATPAAPADATGVDSTSSATSPGTANGGLAAPADAATEKPAASGKPPSTHLQAPSANDTVPLLATPRTTDGQSSPPPSGASNGSGGTGA